MAKQPKEFGVLLEQVRQEVQILAEGHVALTEKVDAGFASVDARFTSMEARMDAKFEGVLSEVRTVASAVHSLARDLREHAH